MKKKLMLAVLLLVTTTAMSQLTQNFDKHLGSASWDAGKSVCKTADGGFVVAAETNSPQFIWGLEANLRGLVIVKFLADGTPEWIRPLAIMGGQNTGVSQIIQSSDGGLIVIGSKNAMNSLFPISKGGTDGFIVKLNSSGILLWTKIYGGSSDDFLKSVCKTADGYIVGGYSYSNYIVNGSDTIFNGRYGFMMPNGNPVYSQDAWLVKVDLNGNLISQAFIGDEAEQEIRSVVSLSDGSFAAVGVTSVTKPHLNPWFFGGFYDIIIWRFNSPNDIIWAKNYGGAQTEEAYSVIQTVDNNIIIAGYTDSYNNDFSNSNGARDGFLLKIDLAGNKIWSNCYGGVNVDYFNNTIESNGKIIAVGVNASQDYTANKLDGWMVIVDQNGQLIDQVVKGGNNCDYFYSVTQLNNGTIVPVGEHAMFWSEIWYLGYQYTTKPMFELAEEEEIEILKVFPNPAKSGDEIFISFPAVQQDTKLVISGINEVFQKPTIIIVEKNQTSVSIQLKQGVYSLILGDYNSKIIVK